MVRQINVKDDKLWNKPNGTYFFIHPFIHFIYIEPYLILFIHFSLVSFHFSFIDCLSVHLIQSGEDVKRRKSGNQISKYDKWISLFILKNNWRNESCAKRFFYCLKIFKNLLSSCFVFFSTSQLFRLICSMWQWRIRGVFMKILIFDKSKSLTACYYSRLKWPHELLNWVWDEGKHSGNQVLKHVFSCVSSAQFSNIPKAWGRNHRGSTLIILGRRIEFIALK